MLYVRISCVHHTAATELTSRYIAVSDDVTAVSDDVTAVSGDVTAVSGDVTVAHSRCENACYPQYMGQLVHVCIDWVPCFCDVMLVDVNECDDVRHNQCEHTCVDTMTGFYCTCNDGFTLMSDLKACRGQRTVPCESLFV